MGKNVQVCMLLGLAADTPTVRRPVNHGQQQQAAHGSGLRAAGGGRELAGGPPRSLGPAARAAQGLGRKEIHEFLSLNPVAGIPAVDAQGRRTGTERYPGEAARGHTVPPLARRAAPRKRLGLCGGQGTTPVSLFSLRRTPKPRSSTAPSPQSGRQPPTPPHPAAAASRARALRGPAGACRGSATRPPDACASPVPGAVKSRTPVTWIFTRQEAAAPPSLPARSDRNPRSTLWSEHTVPVSWPVTHSALRRAPARFSETRRGLAKGLCLASSCQSGCRGAAPRWMLLEP